MVDDLILRQMGLRQYFLKDEFKLKFVDKTLVGEDLIGNFPIFLVAFEPNIAKSYLYNFFGYLLSFSYPCYWLFNDELLLSEEEKLRTVVIGPDEKIFGPLKNSSLKVDIGINADVNCKKMLWDKIKPYVLKFKELGLTTKAHNKAKVVIDRELIENSQKYGKWGLNLAGFLALSKIDVAFSLDDIDEKGAYITPNSLNSSNASTSLIEIIVNGSLDFDKQKKQVFSELLAKNIIKKDEDCLSKFSLGQALC